MIRSIFKTTALGVLAASVSACAFMQAPPPDEVPKPAYAAGPCGGFLNEVSMATSSSKAQASITDYLNCVIAEGQPPPDLQLRIKESLQANPYPGTRRRAAKTMDFFFDKAQLKNLPTSRRDLAAYITMLDAQALRAKAEGDDKFAQAAAKRAKQLATIDQMVDLLEGEG